MQLRDYQSEAVNATWAWLCTQAGNPLIVLPTGGGKAILCAQLAKDALGFGVRVLILAHRKELLEQNADKVARLLPGVDVGIYSAGLKSRDTDHDIVCAGIQSCWKRAGDFGARQLVVIDEAHLIATSGEGMYRKFLDDIRAINHKARLVGLTATPYRTGEGSLIGPHKLFQGISYEAKIPRLIDGGYLSPITSKSAEASADTSGLKIRGGEFVAGEVEQLFGVEATVRAAVAELVAKVAGRKSVLVFAAGVGHASQVAEEIHRVTGETVGVVTGETFAMERASFLSLFRRGSLRWLVNVDVLTTGFDAPNIDAIAVLRATCSPGLFAQICGRGFRLAPGKSDCLVLDFGENIKRHGPLDSSDYGALKTKRLMMEQSGPTRTCPNCGEVVPISATECACGFLFPRQATPRHGEQAGSDAILTTQIEPEHWVVEAVSMRLWTRKKDGSRTLRVDYECQRDGVSGNLAAEVISEWICLEHEGFAGRKASEWWRKRCREIPESIEHAVELFDRGAVATPRAITTRKEGKFYRITAYQLDPIPDASEIAGEAVVEAMPWEMGASHDDIPF